MNKLFIVVPECIEEELRAFGKPLTLLKDPVALLNTLSRNSVTLYWLANSVSGEILPSYLRNTLFTLGYASGMHMFWSGFDDLYRDKVAAMTATYPDKYPRICADGGLAKDPEFPDTFEGNYFVDFFEIDSETIGLRLYQCKPEAIPVEQRTLGMTVEVLTMGGLVEFLKPRYRADELIKTSMVNEITKNNHLYGTLLKDGRKVA